MDLLGGEFVHWAELERVQVGASMWYPLWNVFSIALLRFNTGVRLVAFWLEAKAVSLFCPSLSSLSDHADGFRVGICGVWA